MKPKPEFFADSGSFRAWLERNAATADELLVGFLKRKTCQPSITWPEAVDEALCFDWIDGIRRSLDAERYVIRFTPRRARSKWSAVNIERVNALKAANRMKPAGLAAFERRSEHKSRVYSYEQRKSARLAPAETRRFKSVPGAWEYFRDQPTGYRKTVTWWVRSAAQRETRSRRLDRLIEACRARRRLFE